MKKNHLKIKKELKYLIKQIFQWPTEDKDLEGIEKSQISKLKSIASNNDMKLVFGVVGKSGSGKSTTLNSLFGLDLPVSHIEAGTTELITTDIEFEGDINISKKRKLKGYEEFKKLDFTLGKGRSSLVIYDFPGLQYSESEDKKTIKSLKKHLPECDVILWVVSSTDRAIKFDENFIKKLPEKVKDKIVIGISKSDEMPPSDSWRKRSKLPSPDQFEKLMKKKKFLSDRFAIDIEKVIEYAGDYYTYVEKGTNKNRRVDKRFNLYTLGEVLVHSCRKEHSYLWTL